MKYILINDILSFIKKYYRYLLGYFIILISMIFIQNIVGFKSDENLFIDIVGLNLDSNGNLYSLLMFLLNLAIHLLVIFQIFDNDIKNGLTNIFLRINKQKWIIYKYISITFINLILRLIVYSLTFIFFKILSGSLSINIIKYFLINFLFIMLIDYLFLNIYILTKKNKILLYIVFIITISLGVFLKNIRIVDFNIFILLLLNLLLSYLFYYFSKSKYINILE